MLAVSLFLTSLSPSQHAYSLEKLEGKCSWYGEPFHTRTTANGEKYDMYGISAAHKTLPFGTLLRVTNLKNQRVTVTRVNDRGPVAPVLIMDMSHGAAMALDMVSDGTANVSMEIVGTKKGLLTKNETFFLNLDDPLIQKEKSALLDKNITEEEKIYYTDISQSIQIYNKIKKNLDKLYSAGIQNATELLISLDNTVCIGPFDSFKEAEKYYFRLATLYPHASIWLKPITSAKKLVPHKTKSETKS